MYCNLFEEIHEGGSELKFVEPEVGWNRKIKFMNMGSEWRGKGESWACLNDLKEAKGRGRKTETSAVPLHGQRC